MSNQSAQFKHYLELHFIVLLFGFTAILGKLVSISAGQLVFYRMTLAALGMAFFLFLQKKSFKLPTKDLGRILVVGLIVAAHWVFFFEAVKVSNVSLTLGVMSSGTLFVALIEPLVEKRKIYWIELLIGLIIIIGLYILTRFAFHYIWGIVYALISSFLAALFGVFNRQLTQKHDPLKISFYEMISGFTGLGLYLLISGNSIILPNQFETWDFLWIPILAFLCTAYAFVGTVRLMRYLTAYTVALSINLEPVYGIILAFFIFGESEQMDFGFYIGALILLVTIFIYPILKKKFHPEA